MARSTTFAGGMTVPPTCTIAASMICLATRPEPPSASIVYVSVSASVTGEGQRLGIRSTAAASPSHESVTIRLRVRSSIKAALDGAVRVHTPRLGMYVGMFELTSEPRSVLVGDDAARALMWPMADDVARG
eukprot:7135892-Prymnesium_polylepis.1